MATLSRVMDPAGPISVVESAMKAGVVRHMGITSHAIRIAIEAVKTNRFETVMFPFNFMTPEPALELLPLTRERDMGFIAMKPLNGGMLDNVTLAFKYFFQFPDVLPLVGIEAPHEIDEILAVFRGPRGLSAAEKAEMERLTKEMGNRFCRRCDYCQPCEQGIRPSSVFSMKSMHKRMPPNRVFTGLTAEIMAAAETCIECGKCEERCPYQLPIRQMLKEEVDWYRRVKKEFEAKCAG